MLIRNVQAENRMRMSQNAGLRQRRVVSLNNIHNSEIDSNSYKINIEGPSKVNSKDLSFGGSLFVSKVSSIKPVKAQDIIDFYKDSPLGKMPKELYESLIKSDSAKNYMKVDNAGNIQFHKKSILRLIVDGALYPFVQLPQDILNGSVALLGKIKPLEKWSKDVLNSDFFKGIRRRSKEDAKLNSFRGLAELRQKLISEGRTPEEIQKILFNKSTKMFDPKTGNYDTKHERALNRLVTGLPPAIFLANDAYNLSRMMDDNKEQAEKERKQRFKQETSRILTSGYLTLITLGALQKYINNSQLGIMLMTGSTVLITEMFSRLSNGKHITRLTPEQAKAINAKNAKKEQAKEQSSNVKSDSVKENDVKSSKEVNFKANTIDKKLNDKEKQQKPLLSFDTLVKASLAVIATGMAIKEFRRIPQVDNLFKDVNKWYDKNYKKLTVQEDFTISKDKFDKIVKVLRENGFEDLAVQYEKAGKKALGKNDNLIHLGERDKKIKPLVNFVIAPFKFAKNFVTLPYRLTQRFIGMFEPKKVKKDVAPDMVKSLAMSIDKISKQALDENMDPKKFKAFVSDNILKGFNSDSMSNVSNAELSNLAKTAAAAATIWFLMTDNYNMVMLKSNGEDKEGAETKFKERFVQEGSRLFYQTLLIDLFNSTFRNQYNASLFGMSWISLTNTTMGEWLTRKSVGVPVQPHTRDELLELEHEKESATGFKKKYYNFMTRLTGKRSIESYSRIKKQDDVVKSNVQPIVEHKVLEMKKQTQQNQSFNNVKMNDYFSKLKNEQV